MRRKQYFDFFASKDVRALKKSEKIGIIMVKHLKICFLISLLIFSLLLISSSLASTVCAAEETVQEKGLVILNDVIGLDMTKYVADPEMTSPDSYLGVINEENVRYKLKTAGGTIDVLSTFTDGDLRMIHVLDVDGTPHMSKLVTNIRQLAKTFLSNYESYSGESFYGELESMLDATDVNKNSTTTSENVKLVATTSGDSTTYKWTYQVNDVEATSKCVSLRYKDGFLKYFIDNWDIYTIGNTSINLSEKEAIDLAMNYAKDFSWIVGSGEGAIEINDFNVTQGMVWETGFCSSLYAEEARSADPLTLYPVQHIWISLDKFYPGNVYGIEVVLWADTKEICYIKERFSTLDPPSNLVATIDENTIEKLDTKAESNSISIGWTVFPTVSALLFGTALSLRRKSRIELSVHLPKLKSIKIFGLISCFLLSTTMLMFPISAVFADNYTSRATIWGSESTGGDVPSYPYNTRKLYAEIQQQKVTAQIITDYFSDNGYDTSNYQGNGSITTNILANISDNEQNYPRVAVVDFDHGVGRPDIPGLDYEWHFMFEDNVGDVDPDDFGNFVFDYQIYNRTGLGKTSFALINTCQSANLEIPIDPQTGSPFNGTYGPNLGGSGEIIGMPYAWTHRMVDNETAGYQINTAYNMSDNGYSDPDNGDFCYLGFPWGSAALSQTINGTAPQYHLWVENFFNYSLCFDMTVTQALDHTSQQVFQCDFDETDLYNGFHSFWPLWLWVEQFQTYAWVDPLPTDDYDSTLAVYGNGNIKLYQPLLTVNAADDEGVPLSVSVSVDGESVGISSVSERVSNFPAEYHVIEVSVPNGSSFQNFTVGGNTYYTNPINLSITSDTTVTAYLDYVGIPQHCLEIISQTGGTTNPSPGTYWYNQSTPVQVTAIPSGSYVFSHWILDGQNSSSANPITITMNKSYTLQPAFNSFFPYCPLSVPAYDLETSAPINASIYLDEEYLGLTGNTFFVESGEHEIYLADIEDEYVFWYSVYPGCEYDTRNPTDITITSATTFTAYYVQNETYEGPGIVDSTPDQYSVGTGFVRSTFYASNRFWQFYSDGTNFGFSSSFDGLTWAPFTSLRAISSGGNSFDICFDGTHIHYVAQPIYYSNLYYRRGLPNSNGTITWSASEQTISVTGAMYPRITVDSQGRPWIGYSRQDVEFGGYYYSGAYVTKSSRNDGIWSTAASFPYRVSNYAAIHASGSTPIALSSQKVAVIFSTYNSFDDERFICCKQWTGSSWLSTSQLNGEIETFYPPCASVGGNAVHLVFIPESGTSLVYTEYYTISNSWRNPTTIQSGISRISNDFALSIDTNSSDLYCFWTSHNATGCYVSYKKCVSGTWDANATEWIADPGFSAVYGISCFDRSLSGKIGLVYVPSQYPTVNYPIKYNYLSLP